MRALMLAMALLAVTLPASQPADAKSQKEKAAIQFETFWTQRLDGYRLQAGEIAAKHKASAEAFKVGPFEFADGDSRLDDFVNAAGADSFVSGRGQELEAFIEQFKSRPSLGLMQAYLQQRISFVSALPSGVEAKEQAIQTIAKKPDARLFDVLVAIEAAAMAKGEAQGRAEELKLIVENFGSYASEHLAADQRDIANRARWAAALGAIGQSLNRPTYRVNCTTFANMTNCTGR